MRISSFSELGNSAISDKVKLNVRFYLLSIRKTLDADVVNVVHEKKTNFSETASDLVEENKLYEIHYPITNTVLWESASFYFLRRFTFKIKY